MLLAMALLSSNVIFAQPPEAARLTAGDTSLRFSIKQTNGVARLRLDLRNQWMASSALLDERQAADLLRIANQLESDRVRFAVPATRSEGYLGSCEYRDHPGKHPVEIDFCHSGGCSPSVRLMGPNLPVYSLAGITPAGFAKPLGIALEALRAAANRN